MKQLITFILALLAITCQTIAQERQDEYLLDGTSVDYYYQNESIGAVHAEFIDGKFNFMFTAGPNEGAEGILPYRSRKIGDKMYIVTALNEANSNFVTFVFNFNQNLMYVSALIAPKTEQEMILFEKGIIEKFILKEN